jgi:hypothetical protein
MNEGDKVTVTDPKSGQSQEGTVLRTDGDDVTVQLPDGSERTHPASEVEPVEDDEK